jgi:hypothetical protein|tara:strand:- start:252 stop:950 length:699 start_codon:yes stop_codon:yes gene_type:complete
MKINITRRHLEIYITETATKALQAHKEFTLYDDAVVLVKDPLPEEIDLPYCLDRIEKTVPRHFSYGLDSVFIGTFPEFKERQINAFYREGAIYISNDQDDNEDFIDDMVHEISHLAEKTYGSEIYGDQKIAREFLGKRQRLFYLLKAEGFQVLPKDFMETEYSQDFDMFLFQEVGYPLLTQLTIGLFLTPYSITSLSEYFAESFEYFFLKEREYVKKLSPSCYIKIDELEEL